VLRVLLIAILLILIARAFWKVMDSVLEASGMTPRRRSDGRRRGSPPAVRLVRDPVCGTHVAPAGALSLSDGSGTHYFCSPQCRDEYRGQRAAGGRP
jgi:YHS domain-containing protein